MLPALFIVVAMSGLIGEVLAQGSPQPDIHLTDSEAMVRVDGISLFKVRGISSFPASERASVIAERVKALARDDSVPADSITFVKDDDEYNIVAGDIVIVRFVQVDADLEGVPLALLAEVAAARTSEAVIKYRADRTTGALQRSALYSVGLTVLLALLIWAMQRLHKWLERVMRKRVEAGMASLERKSGSAVHRGHLWSLAHGLLQIIWVLSLLVIGYFYLSSVLGTFPYTRSVALLLLEYIKSPLVAMGNALADSIPDLIFLIVLWFVVRFLLRTLKTFFNSVARGRVRLTNFEPEWALTTYRLVRLLVIAFSIVVAYPYIPGSDSDAFKGISLFLGVILSLGSTSFIANIIAGTALTYRGVFREGDWVVIGDEEGRVEQIRGQLVRLRTRDNTQVSIPSSTILNSNVTNLSERKDKSGLVLRCPVGIGYDESWENVHKLLRQAAHDTEGVMPEPEPRVLTNELGNYAVSYTLVVQINDPTALPDIRTRLNQAILDRFQKAGVQIMSPSYVADPATPKIPPVKAAAGNHDALTDERMEPDKPAPTGR